MIKSDLLFLIIGTNPMPNLIATLTRVKSNGIVTSFYTSNNGSLSSTEKIYNKFVNTLGKNKAHGLQFSGKALDKSSSSKIRESIALSLDSHLQRINKPSVIELNFTGGTKVLSTNAYQFFKEYALNQTTHKFILSYVDSEKEKMIYEVIQDQVIGYKEDKFVDLESNFDLSIIDIINIHGIDVLEDKIKTEPYDWELGEMFFNLFVDCSKDEFNKYCKFKDGLYTWLKKIREKAKKKTDPYQKQSFVEKELVLLEERDNLLLTDLNPFPQIINFCDFAINEGKVSLRLVEALSGLWLEDYIFKIVLDLKEKGYILDAVNSVKQKQVLEIDIVAFKKYKLLCISVTTEYREEFSKLKMYEIKERAKQLGGDEAGICFISLHENSQILEDEYRNIWDNEDPKNTLIIGVDRFKDVKELIKNWIGSEKHA